MDTPNTSNELIWAFGPRSRYAHAYPGRKALKAGIPLCGMQCNPNLFTEVFDLDNPEVRKTACPNCLARLAFAQFMKQVSNMTPITSEEND